MPDIKESLDELYAKLHREREAEVKRRIYMLVLIKEDKTRTRKVVAKRIGVHRNTIRDWLSKYEVGGLDVLVQI
jgi:transposase